MPSLKYLFFCSLCLPLLVPRSTFVSSGARGVVHRYMGRQVVTAADYEYLYCDLIKREVHQSDREMLQPSSGLSCCFGALEMFQSCLHHIMTSDRVIATWSIIIAARS